MRRRPIDASSRSRVARVAGIRQNGIARRHTHARCLTNSTWVASWEKDFPYRWNRRPDRRRSARAAQNRNPPEAQTVFCAGQEVTPSQPEAGRRSADLTEHGASRGWSFAGAAPSPNRRSGRRPPGEHPHVLGRLIAEADAIGRSVCSRRRPHGRRFPAPARPARP